MPAKLSLIPFYALLCILFQSVVFQLNGQEDKRQINEIVSALEKAHVDPVGINDELSNRIYKSFIETLDPWGMFFLKEDVASFELYEDSIDDQIKKEEYPFLDLVSLKYRQRLKQVDSIINTIFSSPLNLNLDDTLTFSNAKNQSYASGIGDLSQRWRKYCKYEVLHQIRVNYPSLNLLNKDSVNIALEYASEKIQKQLRCRLDYYIFEDEEDYQETILYEFLNNIAISYDPHSSFFTDDEKDSFETSLSKESLSFGLLFSNEDDVMKVGKLIPGSPAWKSNQINIGDIVKEVYYGDSIELDIVCISDYELEGILMSNDIESIKLVLIKKNGQAVEVELTKEKFQTNENIMTAVILEDSKRVGYLSIPSFYSNWEGNMVQGCANDVAKEILKLKKDSIEGLIIDLRFNGGGSLREAIDFAGIFIDVGPLGIIAGSSEKPTLMKDFNRGTIYKGPLVILINGASASASEVLAGALQAHNRAVVVGNNSYGKSTGQIVLPIDTNYWNGINVDTPTEFVKVTVDKLYNIKNGSHQQCGITPDVKFPDIWEHYIPSESDEEYSLINDSIKKKVYYKPYPELPIDFLRAQSHRRTGEDSSFLAVVALNDSIKENLDNNEYVPISLEKFWQFSEMKENKGDEINDILDNYVCDFSVRNLKYNEALEKIDSHFKNKSEKLFGTLKKDMTLNEAYAVMVDLIETIE